MARPSGKRRALREINSLVNALSTTCVVTRAQEDGMGKNFLVKIDRPVTRRFGAELAKNQLHQQAAEIVQEGKENGFAHRSKQRRTVSSKKARSHVRENVPMDEEKEDEETKKRYKERNESISLLDSSVVIEPKELYQEIKEDLQGLCEVDMEEAESPLPSIDELDARTRNPLAVVEYIDDIYSFYRRTEIISCVSPDYMSNQTDINYKMRAILVDWLIEVHYKFGLRHETLFLAINLIDRYLSRQNVLRKSLQLVGITVMLIACKYEEIFSPQLDDFVIISDNAYTREDVLKMEKAILNTLQFNMSVPTPFVFMRRFLKAAESDTKLEMLSFYLMELCMVDYKMLRFPPSLLSAAVVYTGRSMLRRSPPWNKILRFHSTYTEDQLQECVRLIEEIHQNASEGKLTAVYRKYSVPKYSCIAIISKQQQLTK